MTVSIGTKKTRTSKKKPAQSWYNKKYSAKELAMKAFEGVKFLKSIVNVEVKKYDASITNVNGTTGLINTGELWSLSSIAQGATDSTRNGESILLKSILIRGVVQCRSNTNRVRIMVIRDKARVPGSSAPAVSDILQTTGNSYAPLSPLNENADGRFSILHSSFVTLNTNGEASQIFKYYLDKQFHIKYSGASADDVNLNQVYILLISDMSTTGGPDYNLTSRLSFYDN